MPPAKMPGHESPSFLGKRRLAQDASPDPILVLGKELCPSPCSAQPHSVCTQHMSRGEARPAAFWQMLSPELLTPDSAGNRAQPLPGQGQHSTQTLSFLA